MKFFVAILAAALARGTLAGEPNYTREDIQPTTPVSTPDPVAGEYRLGLLGSSAADPRAGFFGATNESRYEYQSLGRYYALDDDMSFDLKTAADFGVLYYIADQQEYDFTTLYLEDGYLVYKYDYGSGPVVIRSDIQVNDNEWHQVRTKRRGPNGDIFVDGIHVGNGVLPGWSRYLSVVTPLYVGGLPADLPARDISPASRVSLSGCIRDFTVDPLRDLVSEFEVPQCQGSREPGAFSGQCGGHLTLDIQQTTPVPTPDSVAGECRLGLLGSSAADPLDAGARFFGATNESRYEFESFGRYYALDDDMSFGLKTAADVGVLYYITDQGEYDFTTLYLEDGYLVYKYDYGSGPVVIRSDIQVNDNEWHQVRTKRRGPKGDIFVDDIHVGNGGLLTGRSRYLSLVTPLYVGGLPANVPARDISPVSRVSLIGCIKDFTLDPPRNLISEFEVRQCQGSREPGAFFGQYGGYLALDDRFSVGVNMEIALEIKPRRTTGTIFSIQKTQMDFMSLEMRAGELFLTIGNGGGELTAVFSPLDGEFSLCDGEWHTVKVVKEGYEAYIEVDGTQCATVSGSSRSSEANTNNALYFGGLPNNMVHDGILENSNYVGCMKNVVMNGVDKSISDSRFVGDVDVRSCPANQEQDVQTF